MYPCCFLLADIYSLILIVVGGAEEECYEILGEHELRPMVNVIPDEEDVYNKLREILLNKEHIATMQRDSIRLIERHHLPRKVAQAYLDFWESK